jgi:hypothetical protein
MEKTTLSKVFVDVSDQKFVYNEENDESKDDGSKNDDSKDDESKDDESKDDEITDSGEGSKE